MRCRRTILRCRREASSRIGWAAAGFGALLTAATVWAAATGSCWLCQRFLEEGEPVVRAFDQVEQTERELCSRCAARPELCFLCTLPTREDRKTLSDGRYYCARDASRVIFDGERIRARCRELLLEMERPLGRFMRFPAGRIDWSAEDFTQRSRALGEEPLRCRHPAMRFTVARGAEGDLRYGVVLLNGVPEPWLLSAAAHGAAHAWLLENVPSERRLTSATVEGFCEFVAWYVLESVGQHQQAERLRSGDLGQGQLEELLEADRVYGTYRVLEWMQFGAEDRLMAGDTDRIRRLDARLKPVYREPRQVIPPAPAPVSGPEQLRLRSIVGTGPRRLALINNATLATGESGKAHLGTNLIVLKCVEIGDDWVVVEVGEGEPRRVERLQLPREKPQSGDALRVLQ